MLDSQAINSPDHMLDPAAVEAHEDEVLELGMHRNALILLGSTAHVDAILRLTLGDDAGRPAWNHSRGAVHGRNYLATDFAQL